MSINIYIEESLVNVAGLCAEDWELPSQIHALELWLKSEGVRLEKGAYVADIGFDRRRDASGGGGVMDPEMMRIMGDIGMSVYFSEYRIFDQ